MELHGPADLSAEPEPRIAVEKDAGCRTVADWTLCEESNRDFRVVKAVT
jgi:hypothetical protein